MKLLSLASPNLVLGVLCLTAGWKHVGAKDSSKDDPTSPGINLETILDGTGCGSISGCVLATGAQVVSVGNETRSSYGQFVYAIDPGFTSMAYTTEVIDPLLGQITDIVDGAFLLCLPAGVAEPAPAPLPNTSLDLIKIADLAFSDFGVLTQGGLIGPNLRNTTCDGVSVNNIAALYEVMNRGAVSVVFQVYNPLGVGASQYARGQIFVPLEHVF